MLTANWKAAAELGLSDHEHAALIGVLRRMEAGELKLQPDLRWTLKDRHHERRYCGLFNMGCFALDTACGTVACIAGTADLLYGTDFTGTTLQTDGARGELFFAPLPSADRSTITVAEAAWALRNYLTRGEPDWHEIFQARSQNK